MHILFKVLVILFTLQQFDVIVSKKIIKKIWIHKQFGHEALHLEPMFLFKKTITPFGEVSIEHKIEKRDLHERHVHSRRARGSDDIIVLPDVNNEHETEAVIETQKKLATHNNLLTDIILTRVEFHNGQPVDAIKLHSILFPEIEETNHEEVISSSLAESASDLEAQATSSKESVIEATPEPLNIPEKEKSLENISESAADIKSENIVESKPEVENNSPVEQIDTVDLSKPSEEVKEAEVKKKEDIELSDNINEKKSTEGSLPPLETLDAGVIESRETEAKGVESHDINENVEIISPSIIEEITQKSIIESALPIESPAVPVSPVPEIVYIPLYTDIKTPVPIPVESTVVSNVVNPAPPVIVVTEKEVVVVPPPPPPVQTETTVIETEQSPGLFTRGSRFMLNVGSRILKKLLRLVSRVQSRISAAPVAEA